MLRRFVALFMLIFLPVQWSAALAADCCVRHDTQPQEQHAQLADGHQHHQHAKAKPTGKKLDGAPADNKANCDMSCAGCLAHHSACAVFEFDLFTAESPADHGDTPYLAFIADPLPDNLFRPPLALLA